MSGEVAPTAWERFGITSRELEVLEALGQRLSNAEIAAGLYVSVRTVESHVASLMRKLGATRRRELTQVWTEYRSSQPSAPALPPALQLLADPSTFVGRQDEQRRLLDLWHRAKRGQLLVALVLGEAGIGKSRIAAELGFHVRQDGGRVRLGSCFEDTGIPYEPFVQVIGADAGELSDTELAGRASTGASALARVVPGLAARLGGAEPATSGSEFERATVLSSVHGYLCAMARRLPQLVVIEDFHWSTASSRDALRHVCRCGASVPMLLVVTSRDTPPDLDEALAAYLSDLARLPAVEVVALSGLSVHEVGGVLAETPSTMAAADVYAATDGNPLLVLETARSDRGISAIAGLLAARYDRLARAELEVIDVAAVVGAEFDVPLVAIAAERSTKETVKALEAAEHAGLVAALPGQPGRFTFVHPLFRSIRYESLPTTTRLVLHQSVADALRPRADDDAVLPVLARHVCASVPIGDIDEAVDLARRAGRLAGRKLAVDEAADHFRLALTMLDLSPAPDRKLQLHLQIDLADAVVNAGQPEGRSLLLSAIEEARRQLDHEALVNATLALTRLGARVGEGHDDPRVASAFAEALATIPNESTPLRARLLAGLSFELGTDVPRARELCGQALDMARQLDDVALLGHVLFIHRRLISEPALADEREAVANELIELGRRTDDPTLTSAGLVTMFTLRREAGDLARMDSLRAQLDKLTSLHPSPFGTMNEIARAATDRYLAGDLAGAEITIEQLLPYIEAGSFDSREIYPAHLLAIRYQQGRIVELLPLVEQAVAEQPFRAFQAVLVMAFARAGQIDAATQALEALAIHDYDMPHTNGWLVGTEVLADGVEIINDRAIAAVLRDRLAPFAGRIADFIHGVTRPCDQALAQLLLTLGDHDGAAAVASRAIRASRARNTPHFLGRELVLLAEARHRAGQPAERLEPLLDEAHQLAKATGAHLIDQEIARYALAPPA